ncbi:prion-like-(Q/N-rich) domain-bearing protein 25 [Cotesia typhae]|uniref:prion-like-(Q/N-rich) domain-bearing protein 25 n=1 Tax=Cotesia typhae TaxID=2053667 RepID=UPI003D686B41
MPCQYDSHCRKFINHSVCRKNICICDNHHLPVNNLICLPKLGVFCRNDEKCVVENSDCIDNRCQCIINYVNRGFQCVRMDYIKNCASYEDCNKKNSNTPFIGSRFCRVDRDCLDFGNSRCSLNNICICKENNFAFNNQTCYSILNGVCSHDEECEKNFYCVDFKCQCKPFFSSVSIHECKETDLLYSCNDNSECSDSWHAKCSNRKKCICNVNNIAVSNTICLPILDGYCWRDDQCMAGNSICDDFRCKCRPNFVAIADNLCTLRN